MEDKVDFSKICFIHLGAQLPIFFMVIKLPWRSDKGQFSFLRSFSALSQAREALRRFLSASVLSCLGLKMIRVPKKYFGEASFASLYKLLQEQNTLLHSAQNG